MDFQEYPKRVYKDNDSKVVNNKQDELEYCLAEGIMPDHITSEIIDKAIKKYDDNHPIPRKDIADDKEIGEGQKPEQTQSIEETSGEAVVGCGDVRPHEGKEGTPGVLKRKPGRPYKRPMDETGFKPK